VDLCDETLDFSETAMCYEDCGTCRCIAPGTRKPFEAADPYFVDRCAFLAGFLVHGKARLAVKSRANRDRGTGRRKLSRLKDSHRQIHVPLKKGNQGRRSTWTAVP